MFGVWFITFELFDAQHPGFARMCQKLAWNIAEVSTLYVKWFKSYEQNTEHACGTLTETPCSINSWVISKLCWFLIIIEGSREFPRSLEGNSLVPSLGNPGSPTWKRHQIRNHLNVNVMSIFSTKSANGRPKNRPFYTGYYTCHFFENPKAPRIF